MKAKRELRTFELDNIEIREEGDKPKIIGHAAPFDKWSEDLGGFIETINPGAFTRTIKTADIRALFNHNPSLILGRNKAGTLLLEEDEKGLVFDIDPPDTTYARDLLVSISRGDISQVSFAFSPHGKNGDVWEFPDQNSAAGTLAKRYLKDVDLFDISPVTYPAYHQTDVKVRSIIGEEAAMVFEKAERGEELNAEERETITRTIEKLQGYLPVVPILDPQGPGESGSNSGVVRSLDTLRKRLELIAID